MRCRIRKWRRQSEERSQIGCERVDSGNTMNVSLRRDWFDLSSQSLPSLLLVFRRAERWVCLWRGIRGAVFRVG